MSKLLKDVVDKAVHDSHSLARDTDVRVNLLENLEDVDLVSFYILLRSLLLLVAGGGTLLGELLSGLWFLLRRCLFGGRGLLHRRWLLLSGGLLLCLWRHRNLGFAKRRK